MRIFIYAFTLLHVLGCSSALLNANTDDPFGRVACWDAVSRFAPSALTYVQGLPIIVDSATGVRVASSVTVDGPNLVFSDTPIDATASTAPVWFGDQLSVFIRFSLRSSDTGGVVLYASSPSQTLAVSIQKDVRGAVSASLSFGDGLVSATATADDATYALAATVQWSAGTGTIQGFHGAGNWSTGTATAKYPWLAPAWNSVILGGGGFSGRVYDVQFYTDYGPGVSSRD